CSQLQTVEAAPGDAHHADPAVAPGLFGQPGDYRFSIGQLGFCVFVDEHTIRFAAAAQIHAQTRIAVTGEVGVVDVVAVAGEVALAIRDVFQNGRNRAVTGTAR